MWASSGGSGDSSVDMGSDEDPNITAIEERGVLRRGSALAGSKCVPQCPGTLTIGVSSRGEYNTDRQRALVDLLRCFRAS